MREIDLQTWARRNVYGLFSDCDWPFYQVSFPLDVTNLRAYTKKEGLSFYFTLSWLLTKGMEQQEAFYNQAYEGFLKAVSTEMFPMCGMDQTTVDYLLAVMSKHFKRYDTASKCISRILSTSSASKKMKDRAFDLKEEIIREIKDSKA